MAELGNKLAALREKMRQRAEEEAAAKAAKIAEAEAAYRARAEAAGVGSADPLQRYTVATATGGEGTLPLPKTWFGAEQQQFVEAMPPEERMGGALGQLR